ncbi:MAG: DUF5131 family protein [Dehalococcoidales bacterium]|nr:DUF5131 family protein [Dehalococcoidales bacterium]
MKTKIEWLKDPTTGKSGYTINPVRGLCPVDCKDAQGKSYCYARRLYKRFKWNPAITYDNTVWHKLPGKPGDKYFVGSTMELFGDWIDPWGMKEIFEGVKSYPQRTFIFLTKQPQRLKRWEFDDNCWVGVSCTDASMFTNAWEGLKDTQARVKFISFEPLLSWDMNVADTEWTLRTAGISWIILGQCTPVSAKTTPKISWIQDILVAAHNAGDIPVFIKDNLKPLIEKEWPVWKILQEFPGGEVKCQK